MLFACSSSPPKPTVDFKPDYNFSQVKTIAFYHKSGQVSGDNPMQLSDIQRNRIDEALAWLENYDPRQDVMVNIDNFVRAATNIELGKYVSPAGGVNRLFN